MTTTDLAAAAYLLYRGARLVRVIPGAFCAFQFEGDTSRIIDEWNTGEPVGSIKAYVLAEQRLRREIRKAA